MRLGITGSRYGHPDLERWLRSWVARHGVPETFVVGDNEDCEESVDWQAFLFCRRNVYRVLRVRKDASRPGRLKFHERNQMMVDIVRVEMPGAFLGFPCARSRGTWDCLRRGEAAKVPTYVNRRLLERARG